MSDSSELAHRLTGALGDAYEVRHELASGGMATVFLARDVKRQTLVALKVLRPGIAKSLGTQRFRHEIAVATRLEHPHILPILDSGIAADLHWCAMPYIPGETLRARLAREPQLPLPDALRVAREVASALDYTHGVGYVHRDVKPDNIMMSAAGDALLLDFGIARAMKNADGKLVADPMDVELPTTTTGFVLGSPQYMSPEQVGGDPSLDGRTDQYTLGAVLYEMLAGESPFGGSNARAVVSKMFSARAPSVREVRPDVPVAVDDAIQRALSRSRGERFASISEFRAALHIASSDARAGIGGAVSRLWARATEWRTRT